MEINTLDDVMKFYEKMIKFFGSFVKETEEGKKIESLIKNTENKIINIEPLNTNDVSFYQSVLKGLGAPITPENLKLLVGWRQAEGGSAKHNPFNTTWNKPNSDFYNCLSKDKQGKCLVGVRNYATRADGIKATIDTLKNPVYKSLIEQLQNGDSTAAEMARNQTVFKKWGTKDLIIKVIDGYNSGLKPTPKPITS